MKLLAYQIGNLVSKNELANTLNLRTEKIEQYLSVLQRSYHINLVKPFFRNPRKELTKMPKVYFYDTGLRNALVNNFDPLPLRPDRGALIENAVYIQCIHAY